MRGVVGTNASNSSLSRRSRRRPFSPRPIELDELRQDFRVLLLAPKDPFELVRAGVSAAEAVNVASRDEAELLLRLLWSEEDEEEEEDAPPFTCPVAMSPRSRIVRTAVTAPEFGSILQRKPTSAEEEQQ